MARSRPISAVDAMISPISASMMGDYRLFMRSTLVRDRVDSYDFMTVIGETSRGYRTHVAQSEDTNYQNEFPSLWSVNGVTLLPFSGHSSPGVAAWRKSLPCTSGCNPEPDECCQTLPCNWRENTCYGDGCHPSRLGAASLLSDRVPS